MLVIEIPLATQAQPAYAEGFGVAGAHLYRRSECEGGTPNVQRPIEEDGALRARLRRAGET